MHKLLLADDSVTIQRVIELTFSGEDVQVVAVNDGEQAIARIPLEHPDVILADIGMPRKGGYDVAAFVKGRPDLAHIPVLLLAGAFEPVDQARAEQVRADGVLIKPFEPRQVIERVKELLAAGQHRRANHTSPIIEGSLAHPVTDAVEELVSTSPPTAQTAAPLRASEGGQSLDELFESLNQALAFSAPAPAESEAPPPITPRGTPEPEPVATPVVAPLPQAPEPAAVAAVAVREPEMSFEALVVQPGAAGSLDDYFDRLSAAFTYTKTPAAPTRAPERFDVRSATNSNIPGFTEPLNIPGFTQPSAATSPALDAAWPPPEWLTLPAPPTQDAPSSHHRERREGNPILDAVTALLAQPPWRAGKTQEPSPSPVNGSANGSVNGPVNRSFDEMFRTTTPETAVTAPAPDPQDIVDAVTERVLAKLAPAVAESIRQITQQELERRRQGGT